MGNEILKVELRTERVGFKEFISDGHMVEYLEAECSCGHNGELNHQPENQIYCEVWECPKCGASIERCEIEEQLNGGVN